MLENWHQTSTDNSGFTVSSRTRFKMSTACGGRSKATLTFVIPEKLAAIFPPGHGITIHSSSSVYICSWNHWLKKIVSVRLTFIQTVAWIITSYHHRIYDSTLSCQLRGKRTGCCVKSGCQWPSEEEPEEISGTILHLHGAEQKCKKHPAWAFLWRMGH